MSKDFRSRFRRGRPFSEGIASILDVLGADDRDFEDLRKLKDDSDEERLAADWRRVGADGHRAFGRFASEQPAHR